MTWQEDAKVVREAVSSAMVGEWGQNEAFNALVRLTEQIKELERERDEADAGRVGRYFEMVDRAEAAEQRGKKLEAVLEQTRALLPYSGLTAITELISATLREGGEGGS